MPLLEVDSMRTRPLLGALLLSTLWMPVAHGQTVVEMDLTSARQLLQNHKMGAAVDLLTSLTNNYKQYTNIRVHSRDQKEALATLARALRTDFDGSGTGYVRDLTIWAVLNQIGGRTYLAASQMDSGAVLLTTDLDYLKGMLAFEILASLRQGDIGLNEARRKALKLGIEMQVDERDTGERTISFFGHHPGEDTLVGKLVVIEPPDFVW